MVRHQCYTNISAHRDITFRWQKHKARDCAHVTARGIRCVEELGDHHGHETGRLRLQQEKPWTFGSGLITLNQRFRRRRGEMAWERRRIETSIVIVIVTLRDLTYVFSYKLSWTLIGVLWFVSQEVWLTKSWRFDTFWITCYNKLCYSDHSVLEIAMISLPMNWSTGWQLGIKCMPEKLRRRFLRFFCDFVRFFLKNQISHLRLKRWTRRRRGKHTCKRLERTWKIYLFYVTSCVKWFSF